MVHFVAVEHLPLEKAGWGGAGGGGGGGGGHMFSSSRDSLSLLLVHTSAGDSYSLFPCGTFIKLGTWTT